MTEKLKNVDKEEVQFVVKIPIELNLKLKMLKHYFGIDNKSNVVLRLIADFKLEGAHLEMYEHSLKQLKKHGEDEQNE